MLGKLCFGAAALAIAFTSGCVVVPPEPQAPPIPNATCDTKDVCEVMWSEALRWVQSNCRFRIQNMSDMLIQTYKSGDSGDTNLGCEVSKLALGGGRYEFAPNFWVNNMFSGDRAGQAEQAFNGFMASVTDRMRAAPAQ